MADYDYTDNYNFALPETGAENTGQAYNGNLEIIDPELFNARNIITYEGDIVTYEGDIVFLANP
jgi:hypothetical protein